MELSYSDYIDTADGFRQRELQVTVIYDAAYVRSRYEAIDAKVRALSARRLQVLEAFVPDRGELLDFGAGTFRFVEAAKRSGWQAWGYDLVESAHPRRWPRSVGTQPFEVVTFFDSLEHIPDPVAVVRAFYPSVVMISIPECHHPEDAAWFMAWKHRRPGEHLWHWNRRSLPAMFARLGYECVMQSWFEDAYRPRYDPAVPNILTAIFRRSTHAGSSR